MGSFISLGHKYLYISFAFGHANPVYEFVLLPVACECSGFSDLRPKFDASKNFYLPGN